MEEKEKTTMLVIASDMDPRISEEEAYALKSIQKKFTESYLAHKDSVPIDTWLQTELANNLPELSPSEIAQISSNIISTLKVQDQKKAALEKAVANGRSKESWFASEVKAAASYMSTQEAAKHLQELDTAVNTANESLYRTIHTKAGLINQNPNLDGFIAEQYHAQTFNLNAEAKGSLYRAKVLEPDGNGYAKNSVDIVIVDGSGKIVRRYQSKYCKDAETTAQAFEKGDYRGQKKLVPDGQEQDFATKVNNVIEAPDGVTSTPLSKDQAKELQLEAQSGNWNELNWNEYQVKDLAIGIGKQAGQAALMGAAIGAGCEIAQKVWNGEEINGEELAEAALTTGADFGLKAAAAGALKVGVEKGIITVLPKGTPAGTIANIVHVAVENVKIVKEVATGKLTVTEGLEKMEQTTVATVAGIAASAKGAAIGMAVGAVLGPVGSAVGGFIGGSIGYMAGSTIGEVVVKCKQKVETKVIDIQKAIKNKLFKNKDAQEEGTYHLSTRMRFQYDL